MDNFQDLLIQIELHSVDGIRKCFQNGIDPNQQFRDRPLIYELISQYTRTDRFRHCFKIFIEYGLQFNDQLLLSVLTDEVDMLQRALEENAEQVHKTYTLPVAYTPIYQAGLLHICAEFNHVNCARFLIDKGADINQRAGRDEYGFGGQTPVFHTVNQNSNQSAEMLELLLKNGVDLMFTVPGLIWGKGYEWETLIPAVNPLSYTMFGLLPQMHRNERTISTIVTRLLKQAYGIDYQPGNVPCAYLQR